MVRPLALISIILTFLAITALFITDYGVRSGFWPLEPTFMWPSISGLFIITISVHVLSLLLLERRPNDFVPFFLLIMVVKLLFYMIYNLVMILSDPISAPANVVFFFALYISFTLVETVLIFLRISNQKA
jgi:hypothetical protein